jgi:hypothetical protein
MRGPRPMKSAAALGGPVRRRRPDGVVSRSKSKMAPRLAASLILSAWLTRQLLLSRRGIDLDLGVNLFYPEPS